MTIDKTMTKHMKPRLKRENRTAEKMMCFIRPGLKGLV
jgi:hypothetical protein